MSREVIEDEPVEDVSTPDGRNGWEHPGGAGTRGTAAGAVPDAFVAPTAVYARDDDLLADLADGERVTDRGVVADLSGPALAGGQTSSAATGAGVDAAAARRSPEGHHAGGSWWRRRTTPTARTLFVAVLCLVFGAYVGATSADQNARRTALQKTRILVWAASFAQPDQTAGQAVVRVSALSAGGPVLLHALRTRFGTASLPQDLPLDSVTPQQANLQVSVDCSLYPRLLNDPANLPTTGTAVVRNRPGDALRDVPVELEGAFVVAIMLNSCQDQLNNPSASGNPDAVPSDQTADGSPVEQPSDAPTVVSFSDVTGAQDGVLSYTARLDPGSTSSVVLDTAVLDLISGRGPGKFSVSARPAPPYHLDPGDEVKVELALTYTCTDGKQVLPWTTEIVNPHVLPVKGEAAFTGWDPDQAGVAVRGAISAAGCSPPDDGRTLVVQ